MYHVYHAGDDDRTDGGDGEPVRVMVVDDHPLWREALSRDLEAAGLAVVGTAGSAEQALRVAAAARPDVVVLDLQLPDAPGVTVIDTLVEARGPGRVPRVLVVSASGEHADVLDAVKAGAVGYLVKSARPEELVAAVRRTAQGQPVFGPGLAALVLGEMSRASRGPATTPPAPRLTDRETQVLRLVAKGLSSRDAASQLGVSHRTVQNHVQHILDKLQLRNRVELARYALREGLDDET